MNQSQVQGTVEWIGLRVGKEVPMRSVTEVAVTASSGLEGDRFRSNGPRDRHITFVQHEHLPVVAALLGREQVEPELTRRNLLISGLNLLSLEGHTFQIGDCIFSFAGPCEPCPRMNTTLGPGGLEAMVGHGGIVATVVQPGTIHVSDLVTRLK